MATFDRNEYIKEVNRTIKYLHDKKEALLYVQGQIEELTRALELAEATLDAANDPKREAMSTVENEAQTILIRNGMNAIKGTEFDFTGHEDRGVNFHVNFLKALSNKKAILIEYKPKSQTINVQIDMDSVAGNLRQYASAVVEAREQNNVKGTADPDMLSLFWREKYYQPAREGRSIRQPRHYRELTKTGKHKKKREYDLDAYINKYWKTMRDRQFNFGGALAPWWSILNYGVTSPEIRGTMKGEGTAYPQTKARHFVEKSEREIKLLFNYTFSYTSNNINELTKNRKNLLLGLDYLEGIRGKLSRLPKDINDRPDEDLVVGLIKAQLGTRLQNASLEKIQSLAEKILAGTAPNRARVGKAGQNVEIKIKDIKRRVGR